MLRRLLVVSLGTILLLPAAVRAQDSTAATAAAPAAKPARRSWTADRREFAVGDLITVSVDEYTLASANTRTDATDRRRRDANLEIRKPGGAITGSISAGLGTSNDGTSQQQGAASRENRFQGEIAARVVAVDPQTGLLQLEAHKLVNVDKNQQQITVTGFARPQDVSSSNVLASGRLADAEVVYESKGSLGKPKGGPLSKIAGMLWP